jgi:hypothetical protein
MRGMQFLLSEELFMEFLRDKLQLAPDTRLHHITTDHINRAVRISLYGTDERMPRLQEGKEFPHVQPIARTSKGRLIEVEFQKI